jgi:hypothetical protein
MPDRLQERWHASLAGEAIPHHHREELLVASADNEGGGVGRGEPVTIGADDSVEESAADHEGTWRTSPPGHRWAPTDRRRQPGRRRPEPSRGQNPSLSREATV